jgi:tetrahydromethanopterin S-methyltransferase subunit B
MKIVIILSLLLLASPAFGELTKADLHDLKEDLHKVIKEEITASEKRMKEYIDLKIETMNARIDAVNTRIDALEKSIDGRFDALNTSIDGRFDALNMRLDDVDSRFDRIWLAIIALITAAIALPQLIIIYAERKRGREIQTLIQQLHEKNSPPPSLS